MMLSDDQVEIIDHHYGKNHVRLLHVQREGPKHIIHELEVNTTLVLNDAKDYLHADNSSIVPTDTQKNTVYILAKQKGITTIEQFGMQLCEHFLATYPQVVSAQVYIEQSPWQRVNKNEQDHVHAFILTGEATRFCDVFQRKHGIPQVSAGLKDMKVLKTTQSAFKNFVQDKFTSLPEMEDRIFCTVVYSKWTYKHVRGLDFTQAWKTTKEAILDTFTGPPRKGVYSPSVQQTLYEAHKMALSKIPQMETIEIVLPNVHAYKFDFSKLPALNISNNEEVFTPSDKPAGNICGTSQRVSSKL
jgi:urate oxidase